MYDPDSATSSVPASSMSSAIGSRAVYYNSRRMSVPPVLANDYVAIVQTRAMIEEKEPPVLKIPTSNVDWNQLHVWSPIVQINPFLNESFPLALYNSYEYFRIRSVKFRLTPNGLNLVNTVKTPVFIWYPERSNLLGNSPKNFIGPTYSEMLESGERFHKVANSQEDSLVMECVPQVWNVLSVADNVQNSYPVIDIPAPWLPTTEANKVLKHYMPYFVWKLLYTPGGIPDPAPDRKSVV